MNILHQEMKHFEVLFDMKYKYIGVLWDIEDPSCLNDNKLRRAFLLKEILNQLKRMTIKLHV